MKKSVIILVSTLISFYSCGQSQKQSRAANLKDTAVYHISQTDAEGILGKAAVLTERSVEKKDNVVRYSYTYTATDSAKMGKQTSHLYYLFENYKDEASAKKVFDYIFTQNSRMPGLKKLDGIGDEAFRHTDNENFELVMVRKNKKMIRLKVNKLTGTTSSKAMLAVATKIIDHF